MPSIGVISKTKPRPNRLPCRQRSDESHAADYSVRTMASPDRFSIE